MSHRLAGVTSKAGVEPRRSTSTFTGRLIRSPLSKRIAGAYRADLPFCNTDAMNPHLAEIAKATALDHLRASTWPGKLDIPGDACSGEQHATVLEFNRGLSVAPRGHAFFRDDKWHNVFCFAERADAQKFLDRFGDEWFDSSTRGRGKQRHLPREPKAKQYY